MYPFIFYTVLYYSICPSFILFLTPVQEELMSLTSEVCCVCDCVKRAVASWFAGGTAVPCNISGTRRVEWWSVGIQSRGSLKDHADSHLTVIIYGGGVARGGGEGNEQVYMCCWLRNVMIHSYTLHDFHKCVLIRMKRFFWKTLNEKKKRTYSRILSVCRRN